MIKYSYNYFLLCLLVYNMPILLKTTKGGIIVKKTIKIMLASLLMCLLTSFTSLAFNEGRALITSQDNYDFERAYSYIYKDGNFAKNEWKFIAEDWYYFGEDKTSKQNTWAEIDGKWYYFDSFSRMLHDTISPDGHTLGSDGAWISTDGEAPHIQEITTNN